MGGVFGMQVANSITLTDTHLKKQAIPELGISRTHTHTRRYTLIHDSCHQENVFPRSREAARRRWDHTGRSVADHQYTPHLSLQRAFISHSPSLGISHLNVRRRENLWRTIQYQKKFYFPILDQPVFCRLYCYGAVRLLLHC